MKFDFNIPMCPAHAVLHADDLVFFYYDIGQDVLSSFPSGYDWNINVQEFNDKVEFFTYKSTYYIDDKFEDNVIRFKIADNKKEQPCEAFFRHLRNAFSHYRISRQGEWYFIKDINDKTSNLTMIGKVKAEILKDFCFRFFDQREQFLNQLDELNNPQL